MRTMKMLVVVAVMLAVCAPSFGYVLVYNTISRVKAVDNDTGTLANMSVRGYMIIDFNDTTGDFNEAQWLTYGRDITNTKVYTLPDDPDPTLEVSGRYQSISMLTGDWWTVTVVGKLTNKYVSTADRKLIAFTMSGGFTLNGYVLNGDLLTGSGAIIMTLNTTKTKAANDASENIDDAFAHITDALDTAGYAGE
jgi:hypothetical protein